MADVFISYSREETPTAKQIALAVSERGWSVWWDRTIPAGEDFYDVIDRELDAAHCVVVLWSESSVASRWVRAEATEALQQGKLVPIIYGECRLPLVFRQIQGIALPANQEVSTESGLGALIGEIDRRLSRIQQVKQIPVTEVIEKEAAVHTDSFDEHYVEALKAFFEGIDIDIESVEVRSSKNFFRDIGSVLKVFASEASNALKVIEQARSEFRIEQTVIAPRQNNPLRFSLSHEDAVRGLLLNRGEGFMKPLDAATEAMETLQYHPLAQLAAMQATLDHLFSAIDPEALEREAEKSNRSWLVFSGNKAARFVSTYRKVFASLREQFEQYGSIYAYEFGREYDQQMRFLRSKSK